MATRHCPDRRPDYPKTPPGADISPDKARQEDYRNRLQKEEVIRNYPRYLQ